MVQSYVWAAVLLPRVLGHMDLQQESAARNKLASLKDCLSL